MARSEERRARADLRAVLHKLRKNLKEDGAHDGVAAAFVIESNPLELQPREIDLDPRRRSKLPFRWQVEKRRWKKKRRREGAGSSSAGCKVSSGALPG